MDESLIQNLFPNLKLNKDAITLLSIYLESFIKDAIQRSKQSARFKHQRTNLTASDLEDNLADIFLNAS